MTEDQALAACNAARKALNALEGEIRSEKEAASRAIDDARRDSLITARAAVREADAAHQAALDAKPPHEWDGKRVFRVVTKYARWSGRVESETRIEGVVETRRGDTRFADNLANYSIPFMGEGFVRLLKKDGTPGIKIEKLRGWKLVP